MPHQLGPGIHHEIQTFTQENTIACVHLLLHGAVTSNMFIISKSYNVPMTQGNNEQSAERNHHAFLHRTPIVTFTSQRKW